MTAPQQAGGVSAATKDVIWAEMVENLVRFGFPSRCPPQAEPRVAPRIYAWARCGPAMRDATWTKAHIDVTYDEGNSVPIDPALVKRVLGISGGGCEVHEEGEAVIIVITVKTGAQAGAAHPAATAEAVRRRLMVDAAKGKGGIIGSKGCSILKLDLLRYESDPEPAPYRLPSWRRRHFASGPSLPYEEARIVTEEEDLYYAEVFAQPKSRAGRRGPGGHAGTSTSGGSSSSPAGTGTAGRSFKKRRYRAEDVTVTNPSEINTVPAEVSKLKTETHPATELSLRFTPAEIARLVEIAKKEWTQVLARREQIKSRRHSAALSATPAPAGKPESTNDAASARTRSDGKSPAPPDSRDSERRGSASARRTPTSLGRSGRSDTVARERMVGIKEDEPCTPLDEGALGFDTSVMSASGAGAATGLIRMVAMDGTVSGRNYAAELEDIYAHADAATDWKLLNRERQAAFTALSNAILFEKGRRLAALQTATPQLGDRPSHNGVRTDNLATMYRQLSSYASSAHRAGDGGTGDGRLHRTACLVSVPGMRHSDIMLNSTLVRDAQPQHRPFAAGWDGYCCTRHTAVAQQVGGIPNYHKIQQH